jgi:dienelactone hydrolase
MFTLSARKCLLLLLLCAIVFLSGGYLIGRYRRHRVSPPPQTEAIHLNRYYHFTELMRDPAIECELTRYKSNYDQSVQSMFIMRPVARKSERLFFFFHGMDGDCGDAVVVRELVKRLNATVISVGGRGPAWVSDAFIADAEQVIRTRQKDFPAYYLMGISMGGTQALSLAGLMPEDLSRSMQGVIALIPGSNLQAIAATSSNEDVRRTLQASVGGNTALLAQRSPLQLLDHYKPDLPFAIFYDQQDTLLLTSELEKFIAALRSNHHPVTTFATSGNHSFYFSDFDYEEVMQSLGNNAIENKVPLLSN